MIKSNNTSPTPQAMPLMMTREGQRVRLVEIRGGGEMRRRLAEMGLIPGSEFEIASRQAAGPCIVRVKASRLVLGRGMIHRVFVEPLSD